ncbi:unnamed protein product [Linum tenue]|uniref:Transposase MuDR plant domain-containing protein n=1 Tax=Linum tenue TaxID=586396 RepID=A0AAV0IRH2_9ROSI|nr:unnamed protein product [Linum tenue]
MTRLRDGRSIARFRCVSKLYCCLLSDPNFIHRVLWSDDNHKKEEEVKNHPTQILITRRRRSFSRDHYRFIYSIISYNAVTGALRPVIGKDNNKDDNDTKSNDHKDGLVDLGYLGLPSVPGKFRELPYDDQIPGEPADIILWNPSTSKVKILPTSSNRSDVVLQQLGFGFDSKTKDYKVVRTLVFCPSLTSFTEVYSLRNDSWRKHDYTVNYDEEEHNPPYLGVVQSPGSKCERVCWYNPSGRGYKGIGDDKFTIELHYKGEMLYVLDEDLCYFGGEVKYLDWIDPDCLSLFEMDGYLVEFGFSESVRMMEEYRLKNGWAYYWRLSGERLKEGLQELRSDKDIMDMAAKVIQVSKFVEVYLINIEELTKANLEADKGENEIEVGRDILQSPLEVPHDMAKTFSHNNGTDGGIDGGSKGMNEAEYDFACQNNAGEAEREGDSRELVEINIDDNVESDLERGLAADFEASDKNMEWQSSDGEGGSHDMYIDDVFEVPEEDEAYDSDYLGNIHSGEEGEQQRVPTRSRYPEFNPEKDMNDPQFCLHQIFRDKDTFKDDVKNYSINSKQPLKFKHSDSKRVQVVYQPGCPWNIWVAPTDKAVQIRSCCLRHEGCVLVFKNTFGDANFIAKRYIQRFQADPDWGAASIMQTVAEDYNWTISRWKAWRIKLLAKDLIRGNAKAQYHKL